MIFIDRSIPKGVALALQQVRDDVVWLEDIFAHDTADTAWLPDVGARGWLVITRDKKVKTRPAERRLIEQHGVGCFILSQQANLTRWEYLKLLAATLEKMLFTYDVTQRPFIYRVGRTGIFKRVL